MSLTASFQDWTKLIEQDPYALLGVPVLADERRVLKRYRQIAKQLHPDLQVGKDAANGEFSQQLMAQLINPAYQRLKQTQKRSESLATMRFRVQRLVRTEQLRPSFSSAQQLLRLPDSEIDIFYEQAVSQLAMEQFSSASSFQTATPELNQLNLSFLRCKIQDRVLPSKRTGLAIASPPTVPTVHSDEPPPVDYAALHRTRAQTYLRQQNYNMAVQELREALKIEPKNAELHSLMGQAYYVQKMLGMARAHFRQALTINPHHGVAQKYAQILEITDLPNQVRPSTNQPTTDTSAAVQPASWLNRFLNRSGDRISSETKK